MENIYSTPRCTMLMVHPRLFFSNEQNQRMSKWTKWTNVQMSKHFYLFKKMSKHFYYKMSKMNKWVNEQNAHMSKFGVKWAHEVPIYYKNIPGCTMLMVHQVYHEWTLQYECHTIQLQNFNGFIRMIIIIELFIKYSTVIMIISYHISFNCLCTWNPLIQPKIQLIIMHKIRWFCTTI